MVSSFLLVPPRLQVRFDLPQQDGGGSGEGGADDDDDEGGSFRTTVVKGTSNPQFDYVRQVRPESEVK